MFVEWTNFALRILFHGATSGIGASLFCVLFQLGKARLFSGARRIALFKSYLTRPFPVV